MSPPAAWLIDSGRGNAAGELVYRLVVGVEVGPELRLAGLEERLVEDQDEVRRAGAVQGLKSGGGVDRAVEALVAGDVAVDALGLAGGHVDADDPAAGPLLAGEDDGVADRLCGDVGDEVNAEAEEQE